MVLEITNRQRELIAELLDAAHRSKLHELNRTDSLTYKQLIRDQIAVIEELHAKFAALAISA